jgi:CMP-N,N'-diacetyllegionaminic acid synthase
MRVDAVILARGGSKGIPNKNITEFCGKPLLVWTIEQCKQAKQVEGVWVSSNDHQILQIAKQCGVELIHRPDKISGDLATSETGWLHAIDFIQSKEINSDVVFAPQVTSPLRTSNDIDLAIQKFYKENLDSLFSASIADDFYLWKKDEKGIMNSINYNYLLRQRRQDFHSQIIENGSFYLFKPEILRAENNRFGGKIGYSEMEFWQLFEIDTPNDLRMCQALMREFILEEIQ